LLYKQKDKEWKIAGQSRQAGHVANRHDLGRP
jgi:hypothetical protein